jgi:hypothetical protein
LRTAIDEGRYCICLHVATDPVDFEFRNRDTLQRMPDLKEPRVENQSLELDRSPFQSCQDVLGSCSVCLTDYTTTVERAKVREIYQSTKDKDRVSVIYTRTNMRIPLIWRIALFRTARRWLASCDHCVSSSRALSRQGGLEMVDSDRTQGQPQWTRSSV